jgi:hypothetical protein
VTKNNVTVELFYNGVWNDITKDDEVLAEVPITINQGQPDEQGSFRPTIINMRLYDKTGRKYRISDPQSPLYRLVGRNTPIRVSIGNNVRGVAEIYSWTSDQTQDFKPGVRGKAWVDIQAQGILGRVNRWKRLIRSPIYRLITNSTGSYNLYEYWDMEVAEDAHEIPSYNGGNSLKPYTQVRYTLGDGSVLPPGGMPKLSTGVGVPGSDPLPGFQDGGTLVADVRQRTTYDGYAIDWVMTCKANSATVSTSADVLRWRESGTYVMFTVNLSLGFVTVFHANAADAASLASTGSATASINPYDGAPHHYRYQVRQSGGNYLAELYIDSVKRATADNFTPGMTGTVGQPTRIECNPGEATADTMPTAIGHIAIWGSGQNGGQPPTFFATNGYAIQSTATRFTNLLTDEGITNFILGDTAAAYRMGVQKTDTLFNHLLEIRSTEDSIMYDSITQLGIINKLRNYRMNMPVYMTLYPTDFQFLPKEINSTVDVQNSITMKQRDGLELVVEETSGYLSTQAPPLGVGEEKATVNVNLYDPIQSLAQHGNWWLKKGTIDLPKYPQVEINLAASPHLASKINTLVPGAVIEIVGLRENTVRLEVLAWTETIPNNGARKFVFMCKPNQQFQIGILDDSKFYIDSKTHFLKTAVGKTDTSLTFRSLSSKVVWGINVPYDVIISGERMTVTNMGAATLVSGGYDQVATVVRSVNGIFKELPVNSPIEVFDPQRLA